MQHKTNEKDYSKGSVKSLTILSWPLIIFEKKDAICMVKQEKGYECDRNQYRHDSTKSHRDNEGSHKISISLSNWILFITIKIDVFLLGHP